MTGEGFWKKAYLKTLSENLTLLLLKDALQFADSGLSHFLELDLGKVGNFIELDWNGLGSMDIFL